MSWASSTRSRSRVRCARPTSATASMQAAADALVGRAHRTRERDLVELAQLMPHGRFLGVLLVG